MKLPRYIFKILIFVFIFSTVFIFLTDVLKDKRFSQPYDAANKIAGYYHEPENSLDFIFFGSSHLFYSINPIVLWRDFGIASYDFASNEQPLWISYYYMKEALKYQKPKAVVLDVRYAFFEEEYQREGVNRINFDDIRFSKNKIDMINASVPENERTSFYIEMLKYHSNWENLNKNHFIYLYWNKDNPYKGYTFEPIMQQYPPALDPSFAQTTEKKPIPPRSLEYLYKIIGYTKENNIDLILIKTPDSDPVGQPYYNSVADVAKEQNVPFINFNTIMPGVSHPDFKKAEEITVYMGNYLAENYDLIDHRNDSGYAQWNIDLQYYNEEQSAAYLQAENSINYYLQLLNNPNFVTIISTKNEASAQINNTINAQLHILGFKEDIRNKAGYSYLAVSDGGQILYEQNKNSVLHYSFKIDDQKMNALSAGVEVGNASSIKFNGIEVSKNARGLNIVVYDKILKRVVSSVCFDTHDQYQITK